MRLCISSSLGCDWICLFIYVILFNFPFSLKITMRKRSLFVAEVDADIPSRDAKPKTFSVLLLELIIICERPQQRHKLGALLLVELLLRRYSLPHFWISFYSFSLCRQSQFLKWWCFLASPAFHHLPFSLAPSRLSRTGWFRFLSLIIGNVFLILLILFIWKLDFAGLLWNVAPQKLVWWTTLNLNE